MKEIEEIAISKFKATCLAVLERVRRIGQPVRVTRFGKPVAEVVPTAAREPQGRRLGLLAGEIEIVGDIVNSPWTPEELDEIEAEWLKSGDEQEATGLANEARDRRLALRRLQRKRTSIAR